MDRLRGLMTRLRAIVRPSAADRELDEEIRVHLDMEMEKNVRAGMHPDEARRQALAVFGGRDSAIEAHRDARGGRWIEDFFSDARHAFRTLRQNRALTTAAILTIATRRWARTPPSSPRCTRSSSGRFRTRTAIASLCCGRVIPSEAGSTRTSRRPTTSTGASR